MTEAAWAIVRTHPQAETLALQSIVALGYEAWLPMYRKRLIGSRVENGRRIRSRQDGEVMRPLIQSHLFVLVHYGDKAWVIEGAKGVRRLFRYLESDTPKRVRWTEMHRLRSSVEAGAFDVGFPVSKGDIVQTVHGFVGELISLDERGRAELLAEFMGEKRVIKGVDATTLVRVSA